MANLGEMVEKLESSLVSITALNAGEPFATGSGFVISDNGLIATNYHVIEGSDALSLKIATGETYDRVMVVAADKRRDLALLKIPAVGLKTLSFAPVDSVSVGDPIYAFGNPLGLEGTLSSGIVSAKRIEEGVQILQISAPISSGSSGGPVVNSAGDVVGVSTAVMREGQNLNFAMPARYVQSLMETNEVALPVAEFAAQNWGSAAQPASSSYEGISEWVLEQAMEMEYDLAPILPSLEQLSYPEQEVTFLMALQIDAFMETGFVWMDLLNIGTPAEDGTLGLEVRLESGHYVAFGVCDKDCSDIDLAVVDENGDLMGADEEDDSFPIVEFTLERPQTVLAVLKEFSCDVAPCYHLVSVMVKDGSGKRQRTSGPVNPPSYGPLDPVGVRPEDGGIDGN